MVRLRKEIKRLDTIYPIPPRNISDIPSLGMDIAGYVDDPLWAELQQLVQKRLVAALSRRVDDERGLRTREINFREDGLRLAYNERCVLDVVHRGVLARRSNAVSVDIDADRPLEALAARDGKETATAVGVDKVFGSCGFNGGVGVAGVSDDGEVEVFADVVSELRGNN